MRCQGFLQGLSAQGFQFFQPPGIGYILIAIGFEDAPGPAGSAAVLTIDQNRDILRSRFRRFHVELLNGNINRSGVTVLPVLLGIADIDDLGTCGNFIGKTLFTPGKIDLRINRQKGDGTDAGQADEGRRIHIPGV